MKLPFWKYQATGNDFILIDDRANEFHPGPELITALCDRRFGIGADGLIMIRLHPEADFDVVYYNSDGSQSLCGNGSRAAVKFAQYLGIVTTTTRFNAYDGIHEATVLANEEIRLKMNDVKEFHHLKEGDFIYTGSPHLVRYVTYLEGHNVPGEGRAFRNHLAFQPGGTNVNFVEEKENKILFVRTYERGVEDETLSCGTGVTAVALSAAAKGYSSPVQIKTRGGNLQVEFKTGHNGQYSDIYLIGPAKLVFSGHLEL